MKKKGIVKKAVCVLLVVIMVMGTLAACGGSSGGGSKDTQANAEDTKSGGDDSAGKGAEAKDSGDKGTDAKDNSGDGASAEVAGTGELVTVNVAMTPVSSAVIPSTDGVTAVENAINEIAAKDGIQVKLSFYSSDSYSQQVSLMMAGGEDLDAMMCTPSVHYSTLTAQNQLMDITDLLDTYAPELKALIRQEYWDATSIDGRIRMVTTWDDKVTGVWLCMRKDILEKYDLIEDAQNIQSLSDLEAIYEKVSAGEPDMAMVTCGPSSNITTTKEVSFGETFAENKVYDSLGDTTYCMGIAWEGSKEVTNLYASQEFADAVDVVHDWYNKGWVYKDAATVSEDSYIYVKAGSVFSYFTNAEMNCESDASVKCGTDMVCVMVGSAPISGGRVKLFGWGVPSTSKNPEAAVKFLNLLYTNAEVANLLNYGIEGENYVDKGDGTIGFPEGVDTSNTSYYFNAAFAVGNYFLLKVWEGNSPTLREDALEANKNAPLSEYMGFAFDNTNVKNEITAATAVYQEYYRGLITGVSDPQKSLPEFLNKLETAGINDIIAEKQAQLDEYIASK